MAKRMIILEYDDDDFIFQNKKDNRRMGVVISMDGIEFDADLVIAFHSDGDPNENQHRIDIVKDIMDERSVPAPKRGEND